MYEHLIGKTITAVAEREITVRDVHYNDQLTISEVTLTFEDGASEAFGLSNVEFDATSVLDLPDGVSLDQPETLPDEVPEGHIALILGIDNNHEVYDDVTTWVVVVVPVPPKDANTDDHQQWLKEQVIDRYTGVGHADGDSWCDIEVHASSNPDVIPVGTAWDWGLPGR